MRSFIFKRKAQAVTEFVIIIPVLLLLFVGIYQFTLLMISQIKIAMIEREVMRFVTDEADHKGNYAEFAKEMAGKIGLEAEKLRVYEGQGDEIENGKSADMSAGGISVLNNLAGLTFVTEYAHKLLPAFTALTGQGEIRLKTKLTTAAGGSFTVKLTGIGDALGKIFGQGRDAESAYGQGEDEWEQANLPQKDNI